jgi:transposase
MSSVAQHFIGVDLHKTVLQYCVVDDRGNLVREQRVKISPDAAGEAVFAEFAPWQGRCRVAVEAVGMNRWFVNGLRERGYDVVVADPIKLNLKMLGKKTDKRDAREIARRLWLGDIDRDAKTWYPDDQVYGDRKLVRTRRDLMKLRLHLGNQIGAMLRAYNLSPPARTLHSKSGIKGLLAMRLVNEQLTLCLHEAAHALAAMAASVAALQAGIEKRVDADPLLHAAMTQLPSMGALSTLTLVSELGDVHRFRNAKAVASSGGMVPRVYQSADTAHHGQLTKRGNRGLRFILGQWAVRLMATNEMAAAWGQRRRKRLHVNKVRMALARKLLVGVWVMLSRGEVFDLRRCLNA